MIDFAGIFTRVARKALSFVETEYGFTESEICAPPTIQSIYTTYHITFRKPSPTSDELFVMLSTTPARLERNLEIGCGWPPEYENTIDVFELLQVESPSTKVGFNSGICEAFGNEEDMTEQYTTIANILRTHGMRFFANDETIWTDVFELRQRQQQAREIDELSHRAEIAFKANDWPTVVELLETIGDYRTKLQAARLAYARRRLADKQ